MFHHAEAWAIPFTQTVEVVYNRVFAKVEVPATLRRRTVWLGVQAYLVWTVDDFWAVVGELRFSLGKKLVGTFPFSTGNSPALQTLVLLTPSTPAGVPWLELKSNANSVAGAQVNRALIPAHVFQEVECDLVELYIQRIYVGLTTGPNIGFVTGLKVLSE